MVPETHAPAADFAGRGIDVGKGARVKFRPQQASRGKVGPNSFGQ